MAKWTEDDFNKLKDAIASGILTVKYDGPPKREITYQSLAEMRKLLDEMDRELNGTVTYRRAAHSKGFR